MQIGPIMKHSPVRSRLSVGAAVIAAALWLYCAIPAASVPANPQCSFMIFPQNKSYDATGTAGGVDQIDVGTQANCPWTAVSNVDWLIITNGTNHTGPGGVSFSVQPNTGPPNTSTSPRIGTMTIAGLTFTATQSGCSFSLDHFSRCFPFDGGTDTVTVLTGSTTACDWLPVASASWIQIIGVVGPGNGHFDYSVAGNQGPTARTGTISVGGLIFTVNQDSGISCAFPITPASQVFSASGGAGVINVTSPQCSPCTWTAVSNDPWIAITSGASSGEVRYSVATNTGVTARRGSISVANQTFLIRQSTLLCSYAISPQNQSFGVSGGTGIIEMTATPQSCAWTASSDAPWITITRGGSGSGNGQVDYSVDPNPNGALRSGTITLGGQTLAVSQDGGGCSYSILPVSQGFAAAGGLGNVAISAGPGCAWTAASNDSFITITSAANGSGNGTIDFSVAGNTGAHSRTGTMTIAGQTLTVVQAGTSDSADLSITVAGTPTPVAAGTRVTYQITVSNAGPNPAVGVTVNETIPAGTTFDSIQSPGSTQTPSPGRSGRVTCSLSSIPSGGSVAIQLLVNVLAAPGMVLSDNASVTSLTPDPVASNNSAMATTPVLGGGIITLKWNQPAQVAPGSTPAPTNLMAGPGAGATNEAVIQGAGFVPPADAACILTGYNIYISSSQPVLTIPSNLWLVVPPTTSSQAPVGPAGSFYVVTSLWNCGGTIVESGLTGSSGSNQTGVPAGPEIDSVKVGGKIKATGTGFADSVKVFIGGTGFSRGAAVKNSNTLVVQKGTLSDGTSVGDVITPGATVIISFQNSDGGIGSFSFTQH